MRVVTVTKAKRLIAHAEKLEAEIADNLVYDPTELAMANALRAATQTVQKLQAVLAIVEKE